MSKPKRNYWYRYYYRECVLCGGGYVTKERVYDEPKPDEVSKWHIHEPADACDEHFL